MKSLLLLGLAVICTVQLGCLNHSGKEVDWWLIFKLPKETTTNPTGMLYFYCDSENSCQALKEYSSLRQNSALLLTLSQVNFSNDSQMSVFWNDQPSGGSAVSTNAHSKGVLSADLSNRAFVIQHSTPNFPVLGANRELVLDLPSTSEMYGQDFFCVSMSGDTVNEMAGQYLIAETITYKSNSPLSFSSRYPNMYRLKDNSRSVSRVEWLFKQHWLSNTVQTGWIRIQSRMGLQISMFSKMDDYREDFYESVVQGGLKTSMVFETWGNGAGGLQDPICSGNRLRSNLDIQIGVILYYNIIILLQSYNYRSSKDHSKYGISESGQYVCISDINRMATQIKRGGTAMCFQNSNLWNIINKMFVERQSC